MKKQADDLSLNLNRARWWALTSQPFYGQLAMGLADIIDDGVPTACTDGKVIRWGRKFLSTLTDEETRFIVLHEALHCGHGHLWRLPPDQNGNAAADYVVNQILAGIDGIKMPKGGLVCPPEWVGLAEEEIYARLPPPKKDDKGGGKGQGEPNPCGDFSAPAEPDGKPGEKPGNKPGSGAEAGTEGGADDAGSPLKEEWERRVIQAAQNASAGRGSLPADMERLLERMREQPVDWRREMADFVREVISVRNDWSRSARRHAWQSVIYPRRRTDQMGLVILARDTSGSISAEQCAEFSAHITTALADAGCRGLVLDCDAAIQQEIWLDAGQECPLTAKGGGGTSHKPIWERAAELAEQGERIAGIVCLSDLATTFPDDDGGFATLWVSTSDAVAPFGRTVHAGGGRR